MKLPVSIALAALAVASPLDAQSFLKNQPQRVSVEARVTLVPGRPGALELNLAVTPAPGVHVYAPGNEKYNAVSVTLTPVDGVTFAPPAFPKAEPYFFAPLQESVQVYSKPFRIRVPLKRQPQPDRKEGRSVTVKGTLDYQACDDKLCFPPQSAPFTTTIEAAGEPAPTAQRK